MDRIHYYQQKSGHRTPKDQYYSIKKRIVPSEKIDPVWIRVGLSLLFFSRRSCLFSFLRLPPFPSVDLAGSSLSFFTSLWTFKFGTNFFRSKGLGIGLGLGLAPSVRSRLLWKIEKLSAVYNEETRTIFRFKRRRILSNPNFSKQDTSWT